PGDERVRCFAGLPLPDAWGAALSRVSERLAARLASKITWTPPGNWHSTLRFLGEVEPRRLPEVRAALGRVAFAPMVLRLGPAGAFGAKTGGRAPRTLWAGLAEGGEQAALLAARINAALAPLGFGDAGGRGFRPHVTLGRVRRPVPDEDWGLVDRELGAETFASARVEFFVLWRSVLGRGGPKYSVLETYPARAGGCAEPLRLCSLRG
ncbi:MAG: 2'-5' RNA ligase, partial [Desulfovibrionaceae bacterium CG1_02_65_16]